VAARNSSRQGGERNGLASRGPMLTFALGAPANGAYSIPAGRSPTSTPHFRGFDISPDQLS